MTDALTLAKYIVTKCVQDDYPISNLQLQKILYFVQVETLKRKGKPAFYDEIEAWKFGPVIPNVYYHFCGFGAMPIWSKYKYDDSELTDKEMINEVVEKKRTLDPWDLVEEAHKKNGPWDRVYRNGEGNREVISIKMIKEVG